ncbi:MAG: sulfite exporter TauE/SafE family protein [Bacteroidota bacterium]|nr:sulfite exporter TauE/SafE family protein [Odoribacter sp.]MDP3642933.1 sulfite exporter TauE/SafE family protein [Bacteroidota bacterium]
MSVFNEILIFMAAMAAGFINAMAGGGTLISFPVLLAVGISPVVANVTNTVALVPGTIGGMWSQRKDFKSQYRRLLKLLPVAIVGGVAGGLLILNTSEDAFRNIIPYLILLATLLLAAQVRIKNWVVARIGQAHTEHHNPVVMMGLVFLAAIYGGYFGAGLGVILMAVLGLVTDETMTRLNFLKQALGFAINLAAAIYFAFSGKVDWMVAFVMIFGSLLGGLIGGKLAGKMQPEVLRWIVVAAGLVASTVFFLKD